MGGYKRSYNLVKLYTLRMMRKEMLLLVCLLFVGIQGFSATRKAKGEKNRIVPVVAYTPTNFLALVKSSFSVCSQSVYVDCRMEKDKTRRYYAVSPGVACRLVSSSVNENGVCEVTEKIERNCVAKLLDENDSVFVFLPMGTYGSLAQRYLDITPQALRFWGVVKGDSLAFYDTQDGRRHSLRSLVENEYGSYSNFIHEYVQRLEHSMLNEKPYNAYYSMSEQEARRIVREDYDMFGICHGTKREAETKAKFLDFLQSHKVLTAGKRAELDTLSWIADDGSVDVYCFCRAFTPEEARCLSSVIEEHKALVRACMDVLVYDYGPFTASDGHTLKYAEKRDWVLRSVFLGSSDL